MLHPGSAGSFWQQPDVLTALVDVAQRVLNADGLAVWRFEGAEWRIRAFAGVSETFAAQAVSTYRAAPVVPVEDTGPLVFEDVRAAAALDERLPAYEREGIRAIASIPLLIAGHGTGSLVLYYRAPHQFTAPELETACALGRTAAAVLTARERADFLDRASTALAQSLDLHATAQTVADLAVPFFADACAIHVPGPDGEVRLAAAAHADPAKRHAMLLLARRPHPNRARGWGRTIVEGTVELLEHIDDGVVREALQHDPVLMAAFADLQLVSQLSVPMIAHGRLVGAVTFAFGPGTRRYRPIDVDFAADLARRCGVAIDNARLYEDAQRREADAAWAEQRATFLAEAGAVLASSLEYDETLRRIARLAVPRFADWCAVDIVGDHGAIERLAVAHVDEEKIELARALAARGDPESPLGVRHVIRTARPVIVPYISDEMIFAAARGDLERIALARALRISSYICVPLVVQGRAIGAVTFVAAESGRRFTDSDLRFAEDVALRAALAVENSRAYAEARRANALKDDFLATLSHELRTPLNAILGYSRMLREGRLGAEKQQRAYEIVERNAATLAQIVSDLLDVARITAGKLRVERRPVDMAVVVRDAVAAILPAADARGVSVRAHVAADVGPVPADADRLQQVIWNLVSNAVRFTPKEGRVDVTVARSDNNAVIVVRDTGAGIEPEFLPHVFERFRQGDARFTREHGGLGLGLAIARHLVEMHGGTIRAESDGPGTGATFRVALPLVP
jgi:signal transduction histidine kinase